MREALTIATASGAPLSGDQYESKRDPKFSYSAHNALTTRFFKRRESSYFADGVRNVDNLPLGARVLRLSYARTLVYTFESSSLTTKQ